MYCAVFTRSTRNRPWRCWPAMLPILDGAVEEWSVVLRLTTWPLATLQFTDDLVITTRMRLPSWPDWLRCA